MMLANVDEEVYPGTGLWLFPHEVSLNINKRIWRKSEIIHHYAWLDCTKVTESVRINEVKCSILVSHQGSQLQAINKRQFKWIIHICLLEMHFLIPAVLIRIALALQRDHFPELMQIASASQPALCHSRFPSVLDRPIFQACSNIATVPLEQNTIPRSQTRLAKKKLHKRIEL